jgi:site-specific DNA recombinase
MPDLRGRRPDLSWPSNLEEFLAGLRDTSESAPTIENRQKVLRGLVKEVLVGPEHVVIRYSIPAAASFSTGGNAPT